MENLDELINNQAVKNLQTYLKIPSVHPNIDYSECIKFLTQQAKEIGLDINVYEFVPTKCIAVMTWKGLSPELPSILLTGHMDVVTVEKEKWTRDPFGAEIDEQGNIYARGAQDMKSVSLMYLEAIRRLKERGVRLRRTVHINFTADEEIGGLEGMATFVKQEEFRNLNIGFSMDEGTPLPSPDWVVFHGEKVLMQVEITCTGTTGHACILLEDTAIEKVQHVLNQILAYREKQKSGITHVFLESGHRTSVNLTRIQGGMLDNVVPNEIKLTFDFRLAIQDVESFESFLTDLCSFKTGGISYRYKLKNPYVEHTKLEGNPFWEAFESVATKRNVKVLKAICPGVTDSRFTRQIGIPAIGFSPLVKTPILLHANDEFINVKTFLNGIEIYEEIITAMGNV